MRSPCPPSPYAKASQPSSRAFCCPLVFSSFARAELTSGACTTWLPGLGPEGPYYTAPRKPRVASFLTHPSHFCTYTTWACNHSSLFSSHLHHHPSHSIEFVLAVCLRRFVPVDISVRRVLSYRRCFRFGFCCLSIGIQIF